MTKYIFLIFLFIYNPGFCQDSITKQDIRFGPNILYGLSIYDSFGENNTGHLFEAGVFMNKKLNENFNLNIATNISVFNQVSQNFDRLIIDINNYNPFDSIQTYRSGNLEYKSIIFSLPIRLEFYPKNIKRFGFILGFISRFRISDNITWTYKDITYYNNSNSIISESDTIEENPKLEFYDKEFLNIGFQIKLNRVKITPYINFGYVNFKNIEGINGIDRRDIAIEINWNLSE